MSLTSVEEAQTRALIAQNAALLSLAGNEPVITSKLAATKVSLAGLTAASTLGDTDLLLVRQGTTEKSISGAIVKSSAVAADASTTVKGIVELATVAETQAGTDAVRAVTPAGLAASVAGINQTQQNLSGSRSLNTTYYNTTGKSIYVEVNLNVAAGQALNLNKGGVNTQSLGNNTSVTTALSVSFWVVNGQSYAIAGSGSYTWFETR